MAPNQGVDRDPRGGVVGRWVLVEALVRAVVIEMVQVLVENGAGISFVVDQYPVGAFLPHAADEPLRIAVRPRSPRRDLDHVDALRGEDGTEDMSEFGVPVTEKETERGDSLAQIHQQVTSGLGCPGRGWVGGHAEEVDSSGAHFHDNQDVESAQRDGIESEEIGGQQPGGLGTQEAPPAGVCSAWCGPKARGGQDAADRARAQAMPQDRFSCARRSTSSRISPLRDGRPDRFG